MSTRTDIESALAARDYAALVERIAPDEPDAALVRTRRFAANMLALRERDPALAGELDATPSTGRVRLVTTSDGADSLCLADDAAPGNPLCPGGSRQATTKLAAAELAKQPDRSKAIALAGVGDGAVLSRLAQEEPDLIGRRRVVYVIEPDAEVFRSALLISDWAGDSGPLLDGRSVLAVGTRWRERLNDAATPDSRLPLPQSAVRLCREPRPIASALRDITDAVRTETAERRTRIDEACRGVSPKQIAERLGRVEGARVLLLTTRYSTVLQHSTRDYARAIDRLGGVSQVVIEDEPWQQHTIAALLGDVERFRPDLVIQIDHHRTGTPGVVPAIVPFVCIIQDNLPNLMSRQAAAQLGPTDFAAGAWVNRYVLEHGYPAARCIEMPRLTPAPEAPAVHTGGGADVLYVSNHSADPTDAVETTARSLDGNFPEGARIVRTAGPDLVAHYAGGGHIEDELDLSRFLAEACARHGLKTPPPDRLTSLTDTVNVTINNPLYRQQGLRWTLAAARNLGLGVSLHGKGWETLPDFRDAALGPIDYRELPAATSAARFCMTLEPYFPTLHQRALDTWMWGGLPLIRRRERETRQAEFNAWIARLPESVRTHDQAVEALLAESPDEAEEFEAVYQRQLGQHAWDGSGDLVALYRRRADDGIGDLMDLPPRYDEIAFGNQDELTAVMRTLLDDPDRAEEIRKAQHDWVRPRFCYERGAERILKGVAGRMPGA